MRSATWFDIDTGKVTRTPVTAVTACGKHGYTRRKVAAQVAAIARKERGENVRPYRCDPCHCWHIGHPPGQPRLISEPCTPDQGEPDEQEDTNESGGLRSSEPSDHRVEALPRHAA